MAAKRRATGASNGVLATIVFAKRGERVPNRDHGYVAQFSASPSVGDILSLDEDSLTVDNEILVSSDRPVPREWRIADVRHLLKVSSGVVSLQVIAYPKRK